MCNEVCQCCEKDICKCPFTPKPTLNDIILRVMRNNTHETLDDHSSVWYFSRDDTDFYIQTLRLDKAYHDKLIKKVLELGHTIKNPDYDKLSRWIYTVFDYHFKPSV